MLFLKEKVGSIPLRNKERILPYDQTVELWGTHAKTLASATFRENLDSTSLSKLKHKLTDRPNRIDYSLFPSRGLLSFCCRAW